MRLRRAGRADDHHRRHQPASSADRGRRSLLALAVATIKGSLVAAFFMHLISERKLIYAVLVLTVFFFGVMLWGPWHHRNNAEDVVARLRPERQQAAPTTPTAPHGSTGSGH